MSLPTFETTRLKAEPEFAWRLQELLELRTLRDKPILVLQARPVQTSALTYDLYDPRVQSTLRGGVDDSNSSWDGFFAGGMKPVFHGMAATQETWCLEAHRDGHFLAAIWDFPELPQGTESVRVVPDYYVNFIRDFFVLIAAIFEKAELKADYQTTATLCKANKLAYVAYTTGQRTRIAAPAPLIETLQWPVVRGEVGSQRWTSMFLDMAEGLCAAYGHRSPLARRY